METNTSILSRRIVGLDDCSALGMMSEIIVDCDTRAVSYLLIDEIDGKTKRALPFDKIINIGDSFIVIQSSEDLIEKKTGDEKKALTGYKLIDCPVFSKAGDDLGKVASYEFDPVFGDIASIKLADGSAYNQDQFVFFSADLVFVHDGSPLYSELRAQGRDNQGAEEEENNEEPGDEHLISYLIGTVINEDVVSEDGSFKIEKGTELTEEIVQKARSLNMLIALTMAVE